MTIIQILILFAIVFLACWEYGMTKRVLKDKTSIYGLYHRLDRIDRVIIALSILSIILFVIGE
jgi:hypothetical protein